MANDNPKKRKQKTEEAPASKRARFPFRQKPSITTSRTTTAYPNGELNVSRFMQAHENEIKALESAVISAKKGLSRRAFQDIPISLRRRTGSHNPQRVPHRLRQRAKNEAKEDNTPKFRNKSGSGIGKSNKLKYLRTDGIQKARKAREKREKRKAKEENQVTITKDDDRSKDNAKGTAKQASKNGSSEIKKTQRKKITRLTLPPKPPSRFRRRQVHKTWLPTHVWHAKRATMTPPKEPLWRFAIPLAPAVKAYRLTHRAASLRGAVAWDTSYFGTIGLEGAESSISGLLKALHFAIEDDDDPWATGRRGKKWRDGTRAWDAWIYEREGVDPRKKIAWIAVLWSSQVEANGKRRAFIRVHPSAFLQLWTEVVRVSKIQRPVVTAEDLRFELGSIEIMGPAAAEVLSSILHPCTTSEDSSQLHSSTLSRITAITSVGMLPPGALLAFSISDPRLRDPPQTASPAQDSEADLMESLAEWPLDNTQAPNAIFDQAKRRAADRLLPSQQSINRRKGAATPGQYPETRSTDPRIPMLTYVSRANNSLTVLLPWKSVLPVWRTLMRYPVSTGGNPRFGGIRERRQVNYERSEALFPFDYPGTDAGWRWEMHARVERENEWTKRPKGKRVEWTTIDLGNGRKGEIGDPWACHWESLLINAEKADRASEDGIPTVSSPFRQISSREATQKISRSEVPTQKMSQPLLFTAKISMVQRGVPTDCARIYRLPIADEELRQKWLALQPGAVPGSVKRSGHPPSKKNQALPKHLRTRQVATSLLRSRESGGADIKVGDETYPIVPDEVDLIGFVTTGNYNLAEGRPTAIASLSLHRVLEDGNKTARHLCIVREVGQTFGRLATWAVL